MTIHEASQQLILQLSSVYEKTEAMNIANLVMEYITGRDKAVRISLKDKELSIVQDIILRQSIIQLLEHQPVQYVLHEAWFAGMKLYIDENVLIPRPETEELVEWVAKGEKGKRILDIGTGSGCIPIVLKKKFREKAVFACDISEAALETAARSAEIQEVSIDFIQCDILDKNEWHKLPKVDVIVSNPPYIPLKDKARMHKNVLNYEPHLALFVPDEDPLVFYKAIAESAPVLSATTIYFEIHEEQGEAIVELLKTKGFNNIELRKDMQGKDRMIKAAYKY